VADPDIQIVDVPNRHHYEIRVDGKRAGLVTYQRAPGEITFVHTEIDDAYEGHGLGSRLAAAVLDQARADGLIVRPVCPFIREYIDEHPEYRALVAPDFIAP
jgi:predicted GNAT family acetyltransferase